MKPLHFDLLNPKIVLGIAAHPDDLDFGASGSMAAFAAKGAEIHYLILTDGSRGSADPSMTPEQLTQIRHEEQQNALEILGGHAENVEFLSYCDGCLENTQDVKRDVVRIIRRIKPDVVVTLDPAVLYDAAQGMINHPDHRAAGQAALDAVYPLARDRLSFPELVTEGFAPHNVSTVLLVSFSSEGNYYVDITATIDKKLAALAAHVSQIEDKDMTETWVRNLASSTGGKTGFKYAEGFTRIDVR